MRNNKIKKRWIIREGIVCLRVKERQSFGDLWIEKRR